MVAQARAGCGSDGSARVSAGDPVATNARRVALGQRDLRGGRSTPRADRFMIRRSWAANPVAAVIQGDTSLHDHAGGDEPRSVG
jgi:hypothetical protein